MRTKRSNAGSRMAALLREEAAMTGITGDEDIDLLFAEDDEDAAFEDEDEEESDQAVEEASEQEESGTQAAEIDLDDDKGSIQDDGDDDDDDDMFSDSDSSSSASESDEGERELQRQERQQRRETQKKLRKPIIKKKSDVKKQEIKKKKYAAPEPETLLSSTRRASSRSAVIQNKFALVKKLKTDEARRALLKPVAKVEYHEPTQEERLAQALITEEYNTSTLNKYQQQETEKKRRQRELQLSKRRKLTDVVSYVSCGKIVELQEEVELEKFYLTRDQVRKKERRGRKSDKQKREEAEQKAAEEERKRKLEELEKGVVHVVDNVIDGPTSSPEVFFGNEETENKEVRKEEDATQVAAGVPDQVEIPETESTRTTDTTDITGTTECQDHVTANENGYSVETNGNSDKVEIDKNRENDEIDENADRSGTSEYQGQCEESTNSEIVAVEITTEELVDSKGDIIESRDKVELVETGTPAVEIKEVVMKEETGTDVKSESLSPSTVALQETTDILLPDSGLPHSIDPVSDPEPQSQVSTLIGPQQKVSVSLIHFETPHKPSKIKTYLLGPNSTLPATRRFKDLEPYIHIRAALTDSSTTIAAFDNDAGPDFSILDTLPVFGDFNRVKQIQAIPEATKDQSITITTPAPTGIILPNGNKKLCLITGKQAQYFDPRTGMPYSSVESYKIVQRIQEGEWVWGDFRGGGCYFAKKSGEVHAKGVPKGFS